MMSHRTIDLRYVPPIFWTSICRPGRPGRHESLPADGWLTLPWAASVVLQMAVQVAVRR